MKPKIIVHCLVKNEERFIWYALNSVIPFVDKILVWDTESTDNTVKIIKSINSSKIEFKQVKAVDAKSFTSMRQKMLEETPRQFTWLMILDGDEIWPTNSIKTATDFARKHIDLETIVVHTYNLVGDIYHRLPDEAGQYQFHGHKGHLALRFINLKKINGLHANQPYGQEGYFDHQDKLIQDRSSQKMKILDQYYFHATHLPRSSKDKSTLKRHFKQKYELGNRIADTEIPLIFFESKPRLVPIVTNKAPLTFLLFASILTPVRRLKRLLSPSRKSGY